MGELNNVLKVYMSKPERIQSVLEYYLGEKLPENWAATCVEDDGFFSVENTRGKISFRQRDILKKVITREGHYFLGIENQARINLIFPWRLMQMDSLFYERQIEELQRKNIESSGAYTQEDDYQYRFKKEDRLLPIVNLVLYWGKQAWKHPLGLEDMSDMRTLPENMRRLFQDYGIHVIDMRRIPNESLECMNSDLKYVLGIMKCTDSWEKYRQYIKEHREYFRKIPRSAVDVLRVCTNIGKMKQLLEYAKTDETEEEASDMCKALEMMEKEAEARGMKQGMKQGIMQMVKALVETCAELGVSKEMAVDKVVSKTAFSKKDATEYVNQYWR